MKEKRGVWGWLCGVVALAACLVGVPALADGTDFSSITSGLDTSTVVTAIVAAAALLALVGFAKWAAKKLGRFFGAILAGVGGGSMLLVDQAANATGTDFSSITSGLDTSTVVTAIVAAAALLALVGFAKWAAKKLGRFFG